ncbi:Rne/Rng family ribonuclease [Tessaracoccus caeni]|uniref:Rne/Rng family ribonuclease n=1 Tax=Tessaracoccus caeni TaxID=3031239 RepID=UPI0023D9CF38|nr:Rne/Rng family ribonuclease [Tessaracoccus caeni]MDF1490270.1 Rne/Rng family ribonuclease [Tessaracoccus caeni]
MSDIENTPVEPETAPAPRRRRAAGRKAGPPVQGVEQPAAEAPRTPVTQLAAESPAVVTASDTPVDEPEVKAPTRRRATRKAAAPQVTFQAPAIEAAPKSKAKELASPKVSPELAAPAPAKEIASVEPVTEVAQPAAAEAPETPRPARRRSSTRKAAPAKASGPKGRGRKEDRSGAASAVDDELEAALRAAEEAAAARRKATTDSTPDAADRAAQLAALAGAIAAGDDESREEESSEDVDDETAEDVAEDLADEPDDEDSDDAEDAQGDDENSDDADDEESSDDDSDEDSQPRRRRRRGGRRRRRPSKEGDDQDADAAEDTAEESESSTEEPAAESDSDAEEGDSDGDSGTVTRRRRRRRRRGEAESGEGTSSDEITGIEGSTRMEAKRQRRKESRAAGRRRAPILSEAEFLARRESVDRAMVIRQADEYTQLAVVEDGILVEHYVDRDSATSLIGNIYLGRVQNVLPSMEAAFIDIGRGRNAVLYAGEVDWDHFGVTGEGRKVENVLKSGQMVLVQVTKDPVGQKGARLTSHISLPGRYVVYSPGGHLSGISRKLPDNERHRLRDILANVITEQESVIVRTAAEGASEEELVRDVNRLKAQWEVIEKRVAKGGGPASLYTEPDLTLRIVRDLFTEDFATLVVQGNGGPDDSFDAISAYVQHVAPHLAERLQRFEPAEDGKDVFAKYRIDEQIAKALDRKVFLPSGGSLVIDRTEAMTVIDVNTGRFTGSAGNLEATVTSNNLEAAEEIVRQLRLRDIGGIIVIDFIDMVLPSNRELLLRRLVECLGRDRTRHQVAEVTSLGLVQLTRKKIGTGLAEAFTEECSHCAGAGYLKFDEPVDSQVQADGGERRGGRRGGKKRS